MFSLAVVLALAWLQAPATDAPAGCAGPGTICAEFDASSYVFLAKVMLVTPSPEDDHRQIGALRPQIVQFDVLEDFKGTAGGTATLTFDPAAPAARVFSADETVLVYAKRTQDRSVFFAGCSRTRRVALDEPELGTLRQLQSQISGGSIEGRFELPANRRPPALAPNHDLGLLPISIQALDGSGVYSVTSEPSGYFLIPWLKPGTYRLRFEPAGYVPFVRDVVVTARLRCFTLPPIPVRPR